ncbi:archaea-specific SMC-related protein [Halomicrococcus gelatinilyticus]|uniref:archaea-specific SMC-related protein n=1 Tax=Halomicrococcus gelatinilyticus TaxID=1702103 RepID=UPI002E0EA6E5
MGATQDEQLHPIISARNIGGIDETEVTLASGVTALAGRNATNRTSLLQALMAALGSDRASLKADADEGTATLELGDETYTRTLTREDGAVATSGDPYLDDPELADLFAFLLESNEARQAVVRGDDLRDLIMRPIDTDRIQAEIEQLESEKRSLDERLDELDALSRRLPELEERRTRLESELGEKRAELADKEAEIEDADADLDETRAEKEALEEKLDELRDVRSQLEDARFDIDTEKESLEALRSEAAELQDALDDTDDVAERDVDGLDDEIRQLRDRKRQVDSTMSELQSVIQFNEEMLEGSSQDVADALQGDGESGSASDDAITDQLVDDAETVVCWTCGSEVDREKIEATLDRLRTLRREKRSERNEIGAEIDDVQAEKRTVEEARQEREEVTRRLDQLDAEIEDRETRLAELRTTRDELADEIDVLEADVEALEQGDYSDILDLHREANQLEVEIGRIEDDLEDVEAEIADVEDELATREDVEAERERVQEELTELRTRVDQIEAQAVEQFNEHMATVLDLLDYENLDRIWIERTEREVREGRRTVSKTVFTLHIVRSTESGATYEDTIDHLSESEREVTGLVFALAGYLVHDVYEEVPFILLDSLEAIDADRIAALVDYFDEYADHLVAALLVEDAAALDDEYERVTEI